MPTAMPTPKPTTPPKSEAQDATLNQQKMLKAEQLILDYLDFWHRMDGDNDDERPTMEELRDRMDQWLWPDPTLQRIFVTLWNRAKASEDSPVAARIGRHRTVLVKIDLIRSRRFHNTFRLWSIHAITELFKMSPEVLTMMQIMLGESRVRTESKSYTVPDLADELGL